MLPLLLLVVVAVAFFLLVDRKPAETDTYLKNIPAFSGNAFVIINDNQPDFTDADLKKAPFEYYSELDQLGRCGYAMACLNLSLMPTEERESISHVKPSGWNQTQYDVVDGKNLYNRCHLIGFQLAGENANEKNLITGTRYMNVEGMLPFENMVADYIKETENRVLYRVTPVYDGNNLVATGVRIEAKSIEDKGEGICFHIFVYNIQPGVSINYADGSSCLADDVLPTGSDKENTFVLNTSSKKFHTDTCSQCKSIAEKNKQTYTGDRQVLIDEGYAPAGCCNP